MKKIIFLFLFASIFSFGQKRCPPEGNGETAKEKHWNVLKNRKITKKSVDYTLSIDSIISSKKDSTDYKRFYDTSYVAIYGYLVEFKDGGSESCNCNSEEDVDHDIHIYIGKTPDAKKEDCIICEVTPPYKKRYNSNFKLMKGKKVMVVGYLFYDEEHKGNSKKTCKKCTNVWRATCWEIHPVTAIGVVK